MDVTVHLHVSKINMNTDPTKISKNTSEITNKKYVSR